jgi:hypothetical protein
VTGKPKLWEKSPSCIISMYGLTDILSLVPVRKGIFKHFILPTITPAMLSAALINPPPTQIPALKVPAEGGGLDPRLLLSFAVIGGGIVGEFLVRGLVGGELPKKGGVPEIESKEISKFWYSIIIKRRRVNTCQGPYYLLGETRYPPVFQAMGAEDEVFDVSQVLSFAKRLKSTGVDSKLCVVEGKGHLLI